MKRNLTGFILLILLYLAPSLCACTQPLSNNNLPGGLKTDNTTAGNLITDSEFSKAKSVRSPNPVDSISAVRHLFHRKRTGGILRGSIFGILAVTSLVNTINYKPTTVTVNPGTPSAQTITVDDSPPAGNYIGIGLFSILSITGFTQTSYYSEKHLESILANWKNGKPLPNRIKRKLKKKDFKITK